MQIYKCGLQVTTLGLKGSEGQGLRALSSGGLLVSSLCPASFPLRYEERKKERNTNKYSPTQKQWQRETAKGTASKHTVLQWRFESRPDLQVWTDGLESVVCESVDYPNS